MTARGRAESGNRRRAEVVRKTKETEIRACVDLDGRVATSVKTGIGFFDHMLEALALHGGLGLVVEAKGDLHVDQHHVVEDVGIALGTAVREALGDELRIRRFATAHAPLDDSLARAVVDVSGRSFLHWGVEIGRPTVGEFETELVAEFFRGLVYNAKINLHVDLLRGLNAHHQIESIFKAVALALRDALGLLPPGSVVPSTKGALSEGDAREGPA